MKVKVQTLDGKAGADIDLTDDVCGVAACADAVHTNATAATTNALRNTPPG